MKTATKRKTRVVAYTDNMRLEQMQEFVAQAIICINDDCNGDTKEMANVTGLSRSTIYRYYYKENVSLRIQAGTLQQLAAASGLQMALVSATKQYRIVK